MLAYAYWSFWLFLPAGVANVAPILANKIPLLNKWNTPVDLGKSWRGKRILGDNKRWRGIVIGSLAAGVVAAIEYRMFHLSIHAELNFLAGMLLGLGALAGDATESFFKRQRGIAAGKSWFPFDQIDYIIGGLLVSWPLAHWALSQAGWILATYFVLHLVFSYIGFALGLKDQPI